MTASRPHEHHRPWLADASAFAGYGLVAVFLGVISLEPRFGTPGWIPLLLGLAGLATLAVRTRHPLVALGAAIALALMSLAVGTGAECVLVLIVLSGIGVRRSPTIAWTSAVVTVMCGVLGAWIFTVRLSRGPSLWGSPPLTPRDPMLDWALASAVVVVLVLVTALLATAAGQRRRSVAALQERAAQLVRERDQQAEIASARERERIAREMHDVIAHSLSVMIAIADGAHAVADERPQESKAAIARVAETGRRTLGEVRRLLGSVRGDVTADDRVRAPQPDATRLPALVQEFRDAGLPVQLEVTGTPSSDPAMGLTVYRITQESLTNVLRHARAVDDVVVTVAWTDDDVRVVVRDRSGVPAPAAAPGPGGGTGRGILGMRERVALFDGSVEVGPHADGGWQVAAHLRGESGR